MKKKSFGKWAIVVLLATAMLLGLCVCSKKAPAATATPATTSPAAAPAATTPAPAPAATPAPAPAATPAPTPAPAPVAEPVVEAPAPAPAPTPVAEPVVEPVAEPAPVEAPVEVKEEVKAEVKVEAPVATKSISMYGYSIDIDAYADHAVVNYPTDVILPVDLQAAADVLVAAYPAETSVVTYKLADNLEVYYPTSSPEFVSAILDVLESDLMWYVSKVVESVSITVETPAPVVVAKAEEVAAPVEEVVAPAEESKELTIAEDGTITCWYNFMDLLEAKIVFANDNATVTYPADLVWKSDIDTAIAAAASMYPALAQAVTYEIPEEGTLKVYYDPEVVGGTTYKLATLVTLDEMITGYIVALLPTEVAPVEAPVEVAVAETAPVEAPVAPVEAPVVAPVVEEAPVEAPLFAQAYTFAGFYGNVEAYADHAYVTCDAPITVADIQDVAAMLVAAYPEASMVTYELGEGSLTAYYPACDAEFLAAVAAQLESDANWYLAQLFAPVEEPAPVAVAEVKVEEPAPAPAPAPVAEVKAEEPAPAAVAEVKVEEPAPVAVVEVKVEEPAPVVAPVVAATKAGKKLAVSAGASITYAQNSVKGQDILVGGRVDAKLSDALTIGAKVGYGVRFNTLLAEGFVNFQIPNQQVYLTVGAGTFANAFAAEVGAGVNMPISENFTIFGEGSLLFSADHLMQPTAQFTVGAKYTF